MSDTRADFTIDALPSEMRDEIVKFLKDKKDLRSLSIVSRTFYKATQAPLREAFIDYLANSKDLYNKINPAHLQQIVVAYLAGAKQSEKLALFKTLKNLESEVIYFYYFGDDKKKNQLKIYPKHLQHIFNQMFGLPGMLNGSSMCSVVKGYKPDYYEHVKKINLDAFILMNAVNSMALEDAKIRDTINLLSDKGLIKVGYLDHESNFHDIRIFATERGLSFDVTRGLMFGGTYKETFTWDQILKQSNLPEHLLAELPKLSNDLIKSWKEAAEKEWEATKRP